jgi:NADH:ubiquinone oxidoreductase subunit 2 (subunit N)
VRGAAWDHPVASAGLLLANFSLAGLPLLASFPVRLALLEGLGETSSLAAFGALLGSIGLLAGGLRTLSSLITGPEERVWRSFESWSQRLYLGIGGVALLLVGLFPQFFLLFFAKMPSVFGLPAP